MTIEEHVPLAPFTTFHIGGPARFLARVHSVGELRAVLDMSVVRNVGMFILGGGSNVLFNDAGFDGLVVKIEIKGIEEEDGLLIAGAGEAWDALVARAVKQGLWGIENLSGIPGTLGGAVVQNIGAYGAALSQVLEWVEAFDLRTRGVQRMDAKACAFGYRDSLFKKEEGRYVVLRAALRLSAKAEPNLSYTDLAARFDRSAPRPIDISAVREAVLDIRRAKFPDLAAEGTAGSFFKNPILSETQARDLQARFPGLPLFAMPEASGAKVPLAWLFDRVLHAKGLRVGGARLFERQPLVIAAARGTRAAEVRALAEKVSALARETLSLELEPEVRIVEQHMP